MARKLVHAPAEGYSVEPSAAARWRSILRITLSLPLLPDGRGLYEGFCTTGPPKEAPPSLGNHVEDTGGQWRTG
jgi:hypothetical protein